MFIYNSYANKKNDIKTATSAVVTGTSQLKMRKLHCSLYQVHSKRLHNDTRVPCSLQSPHYKGTGMITSIWNMPVNRSTAIRVSLHP